LRTPITALRNFNELLLGAAADDPEARHEFLRESQAQIERLAWITAHLLDLSRIEAGLVTLDANTHDVAELIEAAVAPFRLEAQSKEVALTAVLPDVPVAIVCDRPRVEVALSNLLDNALKFAPPGGHIEIGAERTGDTVRLWVEDSGPGILPEDLPRVFERFYRGRSVPAAEDSGQTSGAQAGQDEGSGLGLAIVRSIAEAHGGHVSAESDPGQGARFTLELPLEPAHQDPPDARHPSRVT
jgi:two-component system phosphate regulon sensor histidine kinase PhoR